MSNKDFAKFLEQAGHKSGYFPFQGCRKFDETPIRRIRKDMQGSLPDPSELPINFQEFLKSLEGLSDYEMLTLVNDGIAGYILFRPEVPETRNDFNFAKMVSVYKGDCDNEAVLKAGVLRLMGMDPSRINVVFGQYAFKAEGEDVVRTGHVSLVVELDGKFYLLDGNLQNPTLLKSDLSADGIDRDGEQYSISIEKPGMHLNLDPHTRAHFFKKNYFEAVSDMKTQSVPMQFGME